MIFINGQICCATTSGYKTGENEHWGTSNIDSAKFKNKSKQSHAEVVSYQQTQLFKQNITILCTEIWTIQLRLILQKDIKNAEHRTKRSGSSRKEASYIQYCKF